MPHFRFTVRNVNLNHDPVGANLFTWPICNIGSVSRLNSGSTTTYVRIWLLTFLCAWSVGLFRMKEFNFNATFQGQDLNTYVCRLYTSEKDSAWGRRGDPRAVWRDSWSGRSSTETGHYRSETFSLFFAFLVKRFTYHPRFPICKGTVQPVVTACNASFF